MDTSWAELCQTQKGSTFTSPWDQPKNSQVSKKIELFVAQFWPLHQPIRAGVSTICIWRQRTVSNSVAQSIINLQCSNLCTKITFRVQIRNLFNFFCDSCHQLLTAGTNENQPRELKFGTGISYMGQKKVTLNLFFVKAVISCQKLSTAVDS